MNDKIKCLERWSDILHRARGRTQFFLDLFKSNFHFFAHKGWSDIPNCSYNKLPWAQQKNPHICLIYRPSHSCAYMWLIRLRFWPESFLWDGGNGKNEVEFYPNAEFSILECWKTFLDEVSHATLCIKLCSGWVLAWMSFWRFYSRWSQKFFQRETSFQGEKFLLK